VGISAVGMTGWTTALSIAVAACSAVLLGAGIAKLVEPAGTEEVLTSFGVSAPRVGARALAIYEVALGAATLAIAGPVLAAIVGVTYAAAAGVVLAARRAGLGSCGCFGSRSPAPRVQHAIVNLVCAVVAGAGAVSGIVPISETFSGRSPVAAMAIVALTIATAGFLVVASTAAPRQRI